MPLFALLIACLPCESWEYLSESGECAPIAPCAPGDVLLDSGECVCSALHAATSCEPLTGYACDFAFDSLYICTDASGRLDYDPPCEWYAYRVGDAPAADLTQGQFAEACWLE